VTRGKTIFDELGRQDVMCDWREPDHIRVAPVPLYNSFEDVWDFVEILAAALTQPR
jgi:kynureninase